MDLQGLLNQLYDPDKRALRVSALYDLDAIADLTDNTGGTANDTLQAIPNPADVPLSADALRDDIVTNVLPAIRNNLADIAAKVNAILEALR